MTKRNLKWYAQWFDTKYYHILYKDRDYEEAQLFMKNLANFLDLENNAKVLDLACGRGRHSIYLHKLGFEVLDTDLSKNSIEFAKQHEQPGLAFRVQDMSQALDEKFHAVFNLFTSFGYFENEENNLDTLKAIKAELEPGGYGVIDFMNVHKVIKNLVAKNTKTVEGIEFHLQRWVENNFIFKQIDFKDHKEDFLFIERVRAVTLKDFKNYFDKAGIQLINVFGDYHLQDFDEEKSDRLILIFQ
ncbi:class I SAM-dependent methyltransferase [Mesonia aestuariivivens]|uniref:Class I SAM-dependent methyltransferase n=1 Tax=Mesonia aestuariivivens TaxID=2796128 RepID=A0ABS6W0I3_9FLAO|nr:class I SAM-dependent methyltransferase [Mesonia aestuariivivens]MBW2961344.1 class I SAM-dependent methyltransferase [Mesonia aestuariivivens]